VKREVPALHSRRGGEMFSCVRVSQNGCARRVHPFVAIGVVKVPMRVDQMLDRVGTDGCKCRCDLWTRTRVACVNEQLTVSTGKHRNVPTRAHKDTYIAAKFLDSNGAGRRGVPGCLHQPFVFTEYMARSQ